MMEDIDFGDVQDSACHDAIVWEHDGYGGGSVVVLGIGFGMHHRTHPHRVQRNLTSNSFRDDVFIEPGALSAL